MTKKPSALEDEMLRQITEAKLPIPEREFKAIDSRRFRWDFAWVSYGLLLEVQGGVFVRGGHSTGAGITKDCEKLNLATLGGWRVMQVTSPHIKDGSAIKWISEALSQNYNREEIIRCCNEPRAKS